MMYREKKISLIIPVCNTEQYFERCIRSVLAQTHANMEIIIVNDCSSGGIDKIIIPYMEQDSRIRYLSHEKNQGLFRARVTGMLHATGDYVAFMDSDDYISHDFYRTLLDRAENTQADIVIGKTVWEENGNRYVNNFHDNCFCFDLLEGSEIQNLYFSQEAGCYAWHTVWNKLYRKSLVDRCLPVFDRIREHIIMTEDIGFSSVFFYEASRIARVTEEAYFYCANENASTNTSKITLSKFLKNVRDMTLVFDFVDRFLVERGASAEIREHFSGARQHYARMWHNLLQITFHGRDFDQGSKALKTFCSSYSMEHVSDDFFYERIRTPWKGVLEYFKERISNGPEQYISFDIFDTLVLRPFYQPEDLLKLLDPTFHQLSNSQVSFCKLRHSAENLAREAHHRSHPDHQDITLTEIYECLAQTYGISPDIAERMRLEEIRLELHFCEVRRAGKSLYEAAQAAGKKILIVSDMYLEIDTIRRILENCGYNGYERLYVSSDQRRLKYNGDLFRCVISDYPDAKGNTLHIGDTWQSDIQGSEKAGFANLFLPKTRELFEGKISDYSTNNCAALAESVCGSFIDSGKLHNNLGFQTMLAVASQRYFDMPYRPFHPESALNADPWFIGYYLVGMHLMGICKWIDQQQTDGKYQTIHFLSRDGYLPMKAYEIYSRYSGRKTNISYLQTSRKSLLPMIARSRVSFYQLPVEFRAHTAMSLLKLLSFACADVPESKIRAVFKSRKIDPDGYIPDEAYYNQVIRCFLEEFYDEQRHQDSQKAVARYFANVGTNDACFDMGYSGRIQSAICDACGHPVDVLFLHEDYDKSVQLKAAGGFGIRSFYDFRPSVSGLFREHLLSDYAGSCIGYEWNGSEAVPVIEENNKHGPDRFVIERIQTGALQFMEDYLARFGPFLKYLDYSPIEVSLPLESFMRHPRAVDLQIFSCSYFEDEVYGGHRELNIEQFLRQQTLDMERSAASVDHNAEHYLQRDPTLIELLNPKPQWLRAIIWILIDFQSFKERLRLNLKRIFKIKKR